MIARQAVPVPLGIKEVNAYHVGTREDGFFLDVGTNHPSSLKVMRPFLHEHAPEGKPARVLITHGHVDHAGGIEVLRQEHPLHLHAHPAEAELVSTYRAQMDERNDAYADAIAAHGAPTEAVRVMRENVGVDFLLDDTTIDAPLQAGDRIWDGEQEWQVRHLPGHTAGSILLEGDGQVLTGDTLLQDITSNAIEIRTEEWGRLRAYRDALDALRSYEGCTAQPGHFQPFQVTESLLDRHIDRHERRREAILAWVRAGPTTAWQVRKRIFPKIPDGLSFLAMSEVIGHLNSLQHDQEVSRIKEGGVWTYTTTS